MASTPMMPPNADGSAPAAPPLPGTDMTSICFRDQLWLNTYPLDRNLVFDYFALSPFYDWTCNNEQLRARAIHPLDFSHISKMTGMEYTLSEVMEPNLFVIRKQKRDSPEKVTPMLTYYILDGSIYQAPQLCNVFAARLAKVMDGNKTRFWKDIWHEKGNMEDLFPDIYNLIMFQQSTIADLWSQQGWNFIFRRNLNDWEIVRVAEFLNTVNTFTRLQPGEDKLWWTGDDKGVFKVNKSYKLMDQTDQQCSSWPWKSRIPHKVSFFVWSMAKEAVLTQDNVMKRGRTLCSRCFLCGETSETVNHLFLHCKYTHHLWRIFLSHKGISWTMPRKVAEALLCWEEAGVHAKDRGRWRIIPGAIWWAVWKERNSRCFESIENNVQKVKLNCILLLVFWCNQLYSNDTVSIIDVLDSI